VVSGALRCRGDPPFRRKRRPCLPAPWRYACSTQSSQPPVASPLSERRRPLRRSRGLGGSEPTTTALAPHPRYRRRCSSMEPCSQELASASRRTSTQGCHPATVPNRHTETVTHGFRRITERELDLPTRRGHRASDPPKPVTAAGLLVTLRPYETRHCSGRCRLSRSGWDFSAASQGAALIPEGAEWLWLRPRFSVASSPSKLSGRPKTVSAGPDDRVIVPRERWWASRLRSCVLRQQSVTKCANG
jgi:hypothetical protein